MASVTKDSFSDDAGKERSHIEASVDSCSREPRVADRISVPSSYLVAENHDEVPSQQLPHIFDGSERGDNFSTESVVDSVEKKNSMEDSKASVYSGSLTSTTDRLDSPSAQLKLNSGDVELSKVTTNSSEANDAASHKWTQSQSGGQKSSENGPLLTKEQFDDLVRRCSFLAIYGTAKVPKVRYKRLEESVLTICRLFYTRRHGIDWFIEELNRSEGHEWTVTQWVGFLHGSNFKMVKLKAYKGIGNFCYYNGSVFTTAGILGSCKCLREVRTGFGGKQGNRDVLPDEELKALYESEEIAKIDPNAFPDDSEIAPLKPVRPRMTLKRQSDNIAQTYGLENSSFRNPKVSYSMGEVVGDSHSKADSSPVETDSELDAAELEASVKKENDMESTESSESTAERSTEKDSSHSVSRKRVRESSSSGVPEKFDTNFRHDSLIHRNRKFSAIDDPTESKKLRVGVGNQALTDEYLDSIMTKFSVQIQEKLDRAIHDLENRMDLITQRVSKVEERLERQIS